MHLGAKTVLLNLHREVGGCSPSKQPFCIGIAHVYTAVAHLPAEIIMPVGAMQGITGLKTVEEHRPGYTDQLVGVQIQIALHQASIAHVLGGHF